MLFFPLLHNRNERRKKQKYGGKERNECKRTERTSLEREIRKDER
jgi:hypothetical protein